MGTRIRAFLAIDLPEPIIGKAHRIQNQLRERAQARGAKVSWVSPSNMHVTLEFLGDVDVLSIPTICSALGERLQLQQPIEITVADLGAFPSRRRPRTLWVGLRSAEQQLETLHQAVIDELGKVGLARQQRRFRPHLTLGRVRRSSGDLLDGIEAGILGVAVVNEVVLYRSELARTSARYTPLARFALTGAP